MRVEDGNGEEEGKRKGNDATNLERIAPRRGSEIERLAADLGADGLDGFGVFILLGESRRVVVRSRSETGKGRGEGGGATRLTWICSISPACIPNSLVPKSLKAVSQMYPVWSSAVKVRR